MWKTDHDLFRKKNVIFDVDCNNEDVCCNNLISLAFSPLSLNLKTDHSTDRCLNIVITNVNDNDIIRNLNVYLASKRHRSVKFQLIWNWQAAWHALFQRRNLLWSESFPDRMSSLKKQWNTHRKLQGYFSLRSFPFISWSAGLWAIVLR